MDVEVQCTYDGQWVPGFEVIGYEGTDRAPLVRLRRTDGTTVPDPVPADRVRLTPQPVR